MTEPRPDSPSDPEISRLYRQHSTDEPSPAVDQRILAAARAALAGRPANPRGGWWQRWRTPLALATTLLLTVTLSVLHERQPAELPAERGLRQSLPQVRGDEPQSSKAEQAASAAASKAARPATAAGPASLPAAGRAEVPPPAAKKTERDAPVTADNAAAGGRSAAAERKAAPAAITQESSPAATTSPAARSRAEGVRTPAVWLEEIRSLRRAGQTDAAERQLREFRRVHPDYPLPEEFRQ
ncbi:hypothetical protein [Accumulibacter sp.]|jgi:hypothetical protein|uniref:hypothetical protein n=1 Tax=Accumulibacter sp. TaxID=2053492 RepID=UPI001ACF87DD|nr:hypothetical protein [Accumulibacter sp.]MBN8447588.1 hypothetical protein [Candidatus Accumulibacter necessarius]MBN8451792.1 hypothetical protein [Accumulibacter sp.]